MSDILNNNYKKDNWWILGQLPPKNARYIVLDTETTGFSPLYNNIIEVAAIEISKGKITGMQHHAYIKPRNPIDPKAEEKHKMGNSFYDDFYNDVYQSDKSALESFLKFVGNSIIFAHNASFDYNFINNELKYWKLPIIPKNRFRCTMRIFKSVFSNVDNKYKKYCSLLKCCEFFNLKSSKYSFHTAIFDSFMTARVLCKIYEYVENRSDIENTNSGRNLQLDGNNNNGNTTKINSRYEKHVNIQMNNVPQGIVLKKPETFTENSAKFVDMKEMYFYDHENFDPNELDVDCIIQENEGFIKSYMNDQDDNNQIQILNDIPDENINMVETNSTTSQAETYKEVAQSKNSMYKDLMKKFMNTYNKPNEINFNFHQFKDEPIEETLYLNNDDIDEIIKQNL